MSEQEKKKSDYEQKGSLSSCSSVSLTTLCPVSVLNPSKFPLGVKDKWNAVQTGVSEEN